MLSDKIVFITGGASGLGRILVDYFIRENAKVFFTYYKSGENAEKLKLKYGDSIGMYQADANDYERAQEAVSACIEMFGTVDILINNAASVRDASLERSNERDFIYTIEHVLYPVYNYTKAVCNIMIKKECGKVINIGSINGLRGREGSLAYSTAKSGIIGFSKTVAKELGKYNITCNIVAPGYIDTDGQKNTSELIKKLVLDESIIKRLTQPEDVANLVTFLASDRANNITGQVYQIDCGQYV